MPAFPCRLRLWKPHFLLSYRQAHASDLPPPAQQHHSLAQPRARPCWLCRLVGARRGLCIIQNTQHLLSLEKKFYPTCHPNGRVHPWKTKTWSYVAGISNRLGLSRREVKNDVWKYLQTIVMGLYAVCKKKMALPNPTFSLYIYIYIYEYIYKYMYIYIHICICIHTYIISQTSINIYIYIQIYGTWFKIAISVNLNMPNFPLKID